MTARRPPREAQLSLACWWFMPPCSMKLRPCHGGGEPAGGEGGGDGGGGDGEQV